MILLLLACEGSKSQEALTGWAVLDLGTQTTDDSGQVEFAFTVPPNAETMVFHCGPYGYDRQAGVVSLTAPDGTAVYSETAPQSGPLRVPSTLDTLALQFPVSPDMPLTPGDWSAWIRIEGGEKASVSCGVLFRIEPAASRPQIALRFYFAGTGAVTTGLDATGAADNASFASVLAEWKRIWEPVLQIDTVAYEDLSNPEAYAQVADDETLGTLFRETPADRRELPVFVVPSLRDNQGSAVDVRSWGPPGLPIIGGNSRAGIALSIEDLGADPNAMARALAAEGMQYLGLFPVLSADGTEQDPLGDTPVCSTDSDDDGVFSADECATAGADNLLWWSGGASATALTADQAWVIAQSPLVYQ